MSICHYTPIQFVAYNIDMRVCFGTSAVDLINADVKIKRLAKFIVPFREDNFASLL